MEFLLYSKAPSAGITRVLDVTYEEYGVQVVVKDTGKVRFYPYTSFYYIEDATPLTK